jgi:chromosome segregation ATPase
VADQAATFDKEIEEIATRNAKLSFEAENAARECKSMKDSGDRNYRLNMEERQAVKVSLKELSEKLISVNINKEQETAKRIDMQEQNKELRLTIDKLRTQLDNLRSQLMQLERSKDADMSSLKTSAREQGKDLADKTRVLSKRSKELEELRATMSGQIAAVEQKFQDENALYRKRAEEADRFAKDLESAGYTGDLRTQTLVDQLKEKYVAVVSQLDNKLRNEMDQVKMLTNKTRSVVH